MMPINPTQIHQPMKPELATATKVAAQLTRRLVVLTGLVDKHEHCRRTKWDLKNDSNGGFLMSGMFRRVGVLGF
jgi:hypothetical protein